MMPRYCTQLTDRECRETDCCLKRESYLNHIHLVKEVVKSLISSSENE